MVLGLSSGDGQTRRTAGEITAVVATTVLTAAAAIALLLGPALIAVWWIARDGLTTFTLAWIAIAVAWVALLLVAAVRNPETRGWIAVGLFGWLRLLVAAVRAAKRRTLQ